MSSGEDQRLTVEHLVAELMPQGEPYPGYEERQAEFRRQDELNRLRYDQAAEPVLKELAAVGFPVQSVGQLPSLGVRYVDAVPVLARWMSRVDYRPLRDDIVRSLAVPWAGDAAPALLAEFREGDPASDSPDTSPRWVVGLALSAIASPALADELVELAADRRWGAARGMIVQELPKTAHPRVRSLLVELLADETVSADAVIGLGKLAEPATRPALESFLAHPDSWVRNEAKKAVRRIDRAAEKARRAKT